MTKCFLVTETNRAWRSLRRYEGDNCPGPYGYHNSHAPIDIAIVSKNEDGYYEAVEVLPRDDPRWPTKCDHCDFQFTAVSQYQVCDDHIYVAEDGAEHSLRKPVPGMMWFADWMGDWCKGPDGHCLVVVCPDGHQWMVDGPASNCTMTNDRGPYDQAHRCWVRHGTPPNISVDKNGRTCNAGAGSIDTKHQYHGFLGSNGAAPGFFT